jgi:hypothetical protein
MNARTAFVWLGVVLASHPLRALEKSAEEPGFEYQAGGYGEESLMSRSLGSAPLANAPVQVGTPVRFDRPGTATQVVSASSGSGLFAILWSVDLLGPAPSVTTSYQARVYDAFGPPTTPVIDVATITGAVDRGATIAVDASGQFVVAWLQNSTVSGTATLVARRFLADGSPAGALITIGPALVYGPGQVAPFAIRLRPDGSLIATWQLPPSGNTISLVLRAFNPDGSPRGSQTTVSQVIAPAFFAGIVLAQDAAGNMALAYGKPRTAVNSDIWMRRVDASGSPVGAESKVPLMPTNVSYAFLPTGATLYGDGRIALGYEQCDEFSLDGGCLDTGLAWIGADGALKGTAPTGSGFFGRTDQSSIADSVGNTLHFLSSQGETAAFAAANPVGSVVATATLTSAQLPVVDVPGFRGVVGLVSLGLGRTAALWYTGDWIHFQALSVPNDGTAAPFFHTVDPCRIVDTRATSAPMAAGEDRVIKAADSCGVPVGAKAISTNAVAISPASQGDFRFYRPDRLAPEATALSYKVGDIRAGFTVVPLDATGSLTLRATQAAGSTHLILDVSGYFE